MRKNPNVASTIFLGLLPWPMVWLGLYELHSIVWAFVFYHSTCIVVWSLRQSPLPPVPAIVWRRRQWFQLGAACLVVNFGVYLVAGLVSKFLQPHRIELALQSHGIPLTQDATLALFSYFAFANPIFEELFWRETIHGRLREANLPPKAAAGVSGVLFGGWHWLPIRLFFAYPESLVITIGIMIAGFALGLFYDRNRSVLASMLLHGLGADVPILLMLYLDSATR